MLNNNNLKKCRIQNKILKYLIQIKANNKYIKFIANFSTYYLNNKIKKK